MSRKILGTTIYLDIIQIEGRSPTVTEIRDARASAGVSLPMSDSEMFNAIAERGLSLPNDTIYMPPGVRPNDTATDAVLIHEIFHPYQYQGEGADAVLPEILKEQQQYEDYRSGGYSPNPYDYPNNANSLSDIPTYEGQARLVENFTENYLKGNNVSDYTFVLNNSGISSQAIGNQNECNY